MRSFGVLLLLAAALMMSSLAATFPQCPASTVDTGSSPIVFSGCGALITANSGGTFTIAADATQPTNQGSVGNASVNDSLVGFLNNSGSPISAIRITGSSSGGVGSFGFDGSAGVNNSVSCPVGFPGATGYEGPGVSFTNLATTSANCDTGTVNFNPPLASGSSAYFFMERPPNGTISLVSGSGGGTSPVPLPPSVFLGITGVIGLGAYQLRRLLRA